MNGDHPAQARRSANNLPNVQLPDAGQLHPDDVLDTDDLVFSVEALHTFVARAQGANEEVKEEK